MISRTPPIEDLRMGLLLLSIREEAERRAYKADTAPNLPGTGMKAVLRKLAITPGTAYRYMHLAERFLEARRRTARARHALIVSALAESARFERTARKWIGAETSVNALLRRESRR